MAEPLTVSAPATSANLGPCFDALGVALDLTNVVTITPRPGPIEVTVEGEGADELPTGPDNLVWRALAEGLGPEPEGYAIHCRNRIPLGRGLGSSAATVCAGLAAANAIGGLRWSPDDLLERAVRIEGHADNAAACLNGGLVAVTHQGACRPIPVPEDLAFVTVVPSGRVGTTEARAALPGQIPIRDAVYTLGNAVQLVLTLIEGDLDRLPDVLVDHLHEPYRGRLVPGIEGLRGLVGSHGCLGATISGSGPSTLLWSRVDDAEAVADAAREALAAEDVSAEVSCRRPVALGVRARWGGSPPEARLARAVG